MIDKLKTILVMFLINSLFFQPLVLFAENNGVKGNNNLLASNFSLLASSSNPVIREVAQLITPEAGGVLSLGGVKLSIPAGAVKMPLTIRIQELSKSAALDPGLANVTGGANGANCYRFLPSMQFEKELRLVMPFDKSRVTGDDVNTFFYNDEKGFWQKLKRVKVDREAGTVTSVTDHFTDMINGTIRLPEAPAPLSFSPNSIKGLEAANPLTGVIPLKGPEGDGMGSANFSLPLNLPAGRGGMSPGLALGYSSSSPSGWLGVGFSLAIPAITIDTRFGLPEYDGSESYLLNGQELISLTIPGQYRLRREESKTTVERLGSSPANYRFEVTDSSGVTYRYGGRGALRSSRGQKAIYAWHLEQVEEPNGNSINYYYNEVNADGGRELYLSEIRYTGQAGINEGRYRVVFSNESRPDVSIDCRGRFVRRMAERLKTVTVFYDTTEVRRYELSYVEVMGKSSLAKLAEYAGNELFYSYAFDWFKGEGSFGKPEKYGELEQELDRNHSFGGGGSLYAGVGPGFGYSGFSFSGGTNIGFNVDYSFNGVRLLDVNGDGLVDQVIQSNAYNELSVRLNNGNGFDSPVSMSKLDAGMDGNLQAGFSLGFSGGGLGLSGSVGGSFNWSTGLSRFTDLNGDGFVDFIPQPYGNSYKLGTGSGFEAATLQGSGTVGLPAGSESDSVEVGKGFHLADPVKRWTPYHSGIIKITGEALKVEQGGDGVRLDIYKDKTNMAGATLKSNLERFTHDLTTDVTLANALYFKANSIDDVYSDRVGWVPEISYLEINYLDRMAESLNRLPAMIEKDVYDKRVQPIGHAEELKLYNKHYIYDGTAKLYRLAGVPVEEERHALWGLLEQAGLVKGENIPYGEKGRWVSYDPMSKTVYLKEQSPAIAFDGALTIDGLLLDRTISDGIVVEERRLKQHRAGLTVIITNPLDGTYVEIDPAVSPDWEMLQNDPLILREHGKGKVKEYRLIDDRVNLFESIDSLTFDNLLPAEQTELLKYYSNVTKDGARHTLKTLSNSETEKGAAYLRALGLRAYESVQKRLVLGPEHSYKVTESVWHPGIVEEPVSGSPLEKTLPKEKTGYILLESFNSAGDTVLERQYIHSFNSALDFSLENSGPTLEVKIPKEMAKAEYETNLNRLVDRQNEGGSFGDNKTFFSSMYNLQGGRYILNERALSEPYGDGVTKQERLTEILYRLGYGNEYFSGGVYGWYYGEWNGGEAWNPDRIGVLDDVQGINYFSGARPSEAGFSLTAPERGEIYRNRLGFDLWLGSEFSYKTREPGAGGNVEEQERYFASYVTGESFNPSRKGGDSVKRIPKSSTSINLGEFDHLNRSFTKAFNYSASATPFYQTGNFSQTTCQADLFDINGDRYPDRIVQEAGGPLTAILNHRGEGFNGNMGYGTGFGTIRKINSRVLGFGLKFSPEMVSSWIKTESTAKGNEIKFRFDKPQLSVSGGGAGMLGVSETTIDWADMNGDGLVDQIKRDNSNNFDVYLNVGDEFIKTEWNSSSWNVKIFEGGGLKSGLQETDVIKHTTNISQQYNGGAGVDYAAGTISGGISGGRTRIDLIDMNGDGLPDQVMKLKNEPFKVKLNLGDRFAEPVEWQTGGDWPLGSEDLKRDLERTLGQLAAVNGTEGLPLPDLNATLDPATLPISIEDFHPLVMEDVLSFNAGFNISVGVTGTVPLQWGALPVVFYITPSGNFAYTMGSSQLMMRDIDGDGLPDHVLKKEGSSDLMVRKNRNGKAGLLKSITNPAGGVTSLDYKRSKATTESAGSRWVLASVNNTDGKEQSYKVDYEYTGGHYDRAERAFYGYSSIKKSNPDGSYALSSFHNSSYYNRGLMRSSESYGSDGQLYSRQSNSYSLEVLDPVHPEVKASRLVESVNQTFDPLTGESLESVTLFEYDGNGNVTGSHDKGDLYNSGDDIYIKVDYETIAGAGITNLPRVLTVTDSSGQLLRQKRAVYDSRGNMTAYEEVNSGGENPVTTLEYDSYGNLTRITDSSGYSISYTYDNEVQTYVTNVTDSFGYSSSTVYDYATGAETGSTDTNNNVMRREYDVYGRPIKLFTGYDTVIPAVEYFYSIGEGKSSPPIPLRSIGGTENRSEERRGRALTRNKVSTDPLDNETLDTLVIVDGLGRVLQTKKEGERYDPLTKSTKHGMNISAPVVYDNMGRPEQQGQPGFEEGISYGYYKIALQNPTTTEYDAVGRVKSITMPDGSRINNSYRIERGLFVTTVTDPNGVKQSSYRDMRENIVKMEQWHKGQALVTSYSYSLLGEIQQVKDAKGYITSITYDSLGRRTAIDNPDSGLTEYRYNTAGQLTEKVTPNLRALNQAIKYSYDRGRLTRVDYPDMEPVIYSYGKPGALYNRAGRIEKVVDQSGSREYYYGKLGETSTIISSLKSLNPGITTPYIYTEEYRQNYLGQMEWIKYADGEEITYSYDKGGQVTGVNGSHYAHNFNYISQIGYDEFGQRNYIRYGNGVETEYSYDPARRWLDNLKTTNSSNEILQNASYQFDKVGNILSINDVGSKKQSQQTYRYDDLHRLVEAKGTFTDNTLQALPQVYKYQQAYSYDEIGNMTRKVSQRSATPRNNNPTLMNYDLGYSYHNKRPHQAMTIGNLNYAYDANGNQTRKYSRSKGDNAGTIDGNIMENTTQQFVIEGNIMERYPDGYDPGNSWSIDGNIFEDNKVSEEQETVYHWDSENRLTLIEQGASKTGYLYNSSGIATVERSEAGEVVYISELSSIKNEQLFTKHIYVGSTRLASKLGNWGYGLIDLEYEKVNTYYTHGDHLGSATLITNHRGEEYRRYISSPYGETFVKQGDELGKIDYTFTGQRENESTGLIAFPARYYDPKVSRWLSVDPILGDYLGKEPDKLPGEGGVFNPVNLNPYHYTAYNPIVYNDPTGEDHRRYLIGAEGTKAHSIIGEFYYDKLISRGYKNISINKGMRYEPTDKRCYSRKRPDIRADRSGLKYIWEIKQNGVRGVDDALNSIDMYTGKADKAGDAELIPGEQLGKPVRLEYDSSTYLIVYSVGNGIIFYEAWQKDGEKSPVPLPQIDLSYKRERQLTPGFSYNRGYTYSYSYYGSNSNEAAAVTAVTVGAIIITAIGSLFFN